MARLRREPLPRPTQPFLQPHDGAIAQDLPGALEAGHRVAHVADARRALLVARRAPRHPAEHREQVEERGPLAGADVRRGARGDGGRPRGGEQIRQHHVLDVGEVARLQSVAVDDRRDVGGQRLEEERDHRRVGRRGALSRAEDVEVAERDALDQPGAGEREHVLLTGQLLGRVRRAGERLAVLDLRHGGRIAIHGARARVDDAAHAAAARGLEQPDGRVEVGLVRGPRIGDRVRDAGERGEVEDDLHPRSGVAGDVGVAERSELELDLVLHRSEVRQVAARQVVDDADAVAELHEPLDDVRANEAGAPGDEATGAARKPAIRRSELGARRRRRAGGLIIDHRSRGRRASAPVRAQWRSRLRQPMYPVGGSDRAPIDGSAGRVK